MNKPIFLKELADYSYEDLKLKTAFTDKQLLNFREKLLEKGLAKSSSKKDFIFNYVGLIYFEQKILYVLPKYVDNDLNLADKAKRLSKVMLKYSRENTIYEETLQASGYMEEEQFSGEIVLADFLVKDYMEHGLYLYTAHEEVINGFGEIDWYRTIEHSPMLLIDERPLYLEVHTNDQEIDYGHPLHVLHKAILTEASKFLQSFNVIGLFDYESIDYAEEISDIGDNDYLLYLIDRELQHEYSDRKVQVLKAMKNYLLRDFTKQSNDELQLFGIKKFDVIWEKVCSRVYGNQYELFRKDIPNPVWEDFDSNKPVNRATLIPDILVYKPEFQSFFILDAKYYLTFFEQNNETLSIVNNPGVGDVTKQYLYEQALRKNNSMVRESDCYNIFLMPSEKEDAFFGKVTMDIFAEEMKGIYLYRQNIDNLFDSYMKEEKKDLVSLKTFIDQREMKI